MDRKINLFLECLMITGVAALALLLDKDFQAETRARWQAYQRYRQEVVIPHEWVREVHDSIRP